MRSRLAVPLAVMVLALASGEAQAKASALQRAEAAYDDLDFDVAVKLFRQALKEPATRDERIRAHRGLGLSYAFLGNAARAQDQFETLLLLDPDATVNLALGPKISRPFEAAKRAVRGKRPELRIVRDERSGTVSAELSPRMRAVDLLQLHVTSSEGKAQQASSRSDKPVAVEVPPELAVEAYAVAQDAGKGVLFEAGTKEAPLKFPATARPAAVASAVEDADRQRLREAQESSDSEADAAYDGGERSSSRWPLWLGGAAAVVGGGIAAAVLLQRPDPLQLPPADRTGRLP